MTTLLAMVLLGAGTYLIRVSFVVIADRVGTPTWIDGLLGLLTPAVLAALVASTLFVHDGSATLPAVADLAAVAAGVVVVARTRNIGLGLAVGLPVAWLVAALL